MKKISYRCSYYCDARLGAPVEKHNPNCEVIKIKDEFYRTPAGQELLKEWNDKNLLEPDSEDMYFFKKYVA